MVRDGQAAGPGLATHVADVHEVKTVVLEEKPL